MRLTLAAALAVAQFGCYSPDVPFGIPCGPGTGTCPSGQVCDMLSGTCLPPTEQREWRDDSAADFAQPGSTLENATIEAAGFIGPMPYLTGRLRYTGLPTDTIDDETTAAWPDVSAGTPTGRSVGGLSFDWGAGIPPGLGFTSDDDITILVEGEIELDTAGTWRFELTANDGGLVQLAAPGSEDYTTVVTDSSGPTVGTYNVAAPGWFKVRAAVGDSMQVMRFRVRFDAPGGGVVFREVPSDKLRTRVDDLTGFVVDAFDDGFMLNHVASTLVSQASDVTIAPDPFGIEVGGANWTLHFAGQILIEEGGDYAFRIQTHQGARVWIDGAQVANAMGTTDVDVTTPPMLLTVGWHDVVADVMKDGGPPDDGKLTLTVVSGPALAGQTIPADHIRPVEGRGVRWTQTMDGNPTTIADGATITRTQSLDLPANMTPIAIEQGVRFDHPFRAEVSLALDPPVGSTIPLLAVGGATGAGTYALHSPVPASSAGTTFSWIAGDSLADGVVGEVTYTALTLVCSGGIAPFPTTYRYESAVKDLGDVLAFGGAGWKARLVSPETVEVRLCDEPAACAAEPWVNIQLDGMPAPRRYMQYAVTQATNGDVASGLDWIYFRYAVRL